MPTNIEVKAVLEDVRAARETATVLSSQTAEIFHQVDVFFSCDAARLKLRILGPHLGELIRYERSDLAAARVSRYLIARTQDPEILRTILTQTLATAGVVKKTRQLFLVGQTRIHIDSVEGLGDFLELEVVMRPDQEESDGHEIVRGLLVEFGISPTQLVAEAYVDLLRRKQEPSR